MKAVMFNLIFSKEILLSLTEGFMGLDIKSG